MVYRLQWVVVSRHASKQAPTYSRPIWMWSESPGARPIWTQSTNLKSLGSLLDPFNPGAFFSIFVRPLCCSVWSSVCVVARLKVTTSKSTIVSLSCTCLVRYPTAIVYRRVFYCSWHRRCFVNKSPNFIVEYIDVFICRQRRQRCDIGETSGCVYLKD